MATIVKFNHPIFDKEIKQDWGINEYNLSITDHIEMTEQYWNCRGLISEVEVIDTINNTTIDYKKENETWEVKSNN